MSPQTPVDEITPPVVASPISLALAIEFSPGRAALHQGRLPAGIDLNLPHQREIDHHRAVGYGLSGNAVAAAADRSGNPLLAGEANGLNHIGDARGAHDDGRLAVDHAVPHPASRIILANRFRVRIGQFSIRRNSASCSAESPSTCSFMQRSLPLLDCLPK